MIRTALLAIALISTLAVAQAALRPWVEFQITPKTMPEDRLFTVTIKDEGSLKQIDVTVEQRSGRRTRRISPFADATLSLIDADDYLANVTVKPVWEGKKVHFRIKVAPRTIAHSRFEFKEQGWSEVAPGQPLGFPS